ncbi:MAG: IpaD/SipD/SspD family type III secretion system needle tip protein [Glaciimonas sp.]|nr:IpaD/SipD/SspD family type III secretion system needle tip protein [Glaciimonas sp.]
MQAGFKTHEENLKNVMQTLSLKYNNGHDSYNHLLQVLSGMIDVLLSTDKSFFQS